MNLHTTTEKAGKRLSYNSHDMGEMGVFVKLEYAENILRETIASVAAEVADATVDHIEREFHKVCETKGATALNIAATVQLALISARTAYKGEGV